MIKVLAIETEEPVYKWYYGKFIKIGTIKTEKNDKLPRTKRKV